MASKKSAGGIAHSREGRSFSCSHDNAATAAASKTSRPSAHRHNWLSSRSSRFDPGSGRFDVGPWSGIGGLRWHEKDFLVTVLRLRLFRQIAPSVAPKAAVHDRTVHPVPY